MKKLLFTGLLVCITFINFSFTSNSYSMQKGTIPKNDKKIFSILLSNTYPVGVLGCVATVSIAITFSWDEVPGHSVHNVTISQPKVQINCGVYVRQTEITQLSWDDFDAHCIDLEFAPTGDKDMDKELADPLFTKQIKSEINLQVDAQKSL